MLIVLIIIFVAIMANTTLFFFSHKKNISAVIKLLSLSHVITSIILMAICILKLKAGILLNHSHYELFSPYIILPTVAFSIFVSLIYQESREAIFGLLRGFPLAFLALSLLPLAPYFYIHYWNVQNKLAPLTDQSETVRKRIEKEMISNKDLFFDLSKPSTKDNSLKKEFKVNNKTVSLKSAGKLFMEYDVVTPGRESTIILRVCREISAKNYKYIKRDLSDLDIVVVIAKERRLIRSYNCGGDFQNIFYVNLLSWPKFNYLDSIKFKGSIPHDKSGSIRIKTGGGCGEDGSEPWGDIHELFSS